MAPLLAVFSLAGAKAYMETALDLLGGQYGSKDVSLVRIDYSVDILASDFELTPDNFVMPATIGPKDFDQVTTTPPQE